MNKFIGPSLILLAALSWSSAGLFTRVVTTDIPTTLFWRSLFGALCVVLIFVVATRGEKVTSIFKFNVGEVVIASLSTLGMLCFISSFFYTTIANVAFVYGTMPLVTYILALLFLKEKVGILPTLCCCFSVIGVWTMTQGNSQVNDFIGIALAFGMTFFMAALTVATKFFPLANTTKATYLSAFLGALVTFPFSDVLATGAQDMVARIIWRCQCRSRFWNLSIGRIPSVRSSRRTHWLSRNTACPDMGVCTI